MLLVLILPRDRTTLNAIDEFLKRGGLLRGTDCTPEWSRARFESCCAVLGEQLVHVLFLCRQELCSQLRGRSFLSALFLAALWEAFLGPAQKEAMSVSSVNTGHQSRHTGQY